MLAVAGQHGAVSGAGGSDGRWTPTDGYADIRCDEDYEAFYRAQLNAGRRLPPPLQLEQRTLENYSELPLHLQQQQVAQQQHQQQQLMAARLGHAGAGMQHGGACAAPAPCAAPPACTHSCKVFSMRGINTPEVTRGVMRAGLEPINEQRVSPANGGAIPPDMLQALSQLGARSPRCCLGGVARWQSCQPP